MSKKRDYENAIKIINADYEAEVETAIKEAAKRRAERIKSAGIAFDFNPSKMNLKNDEKTNKKAEKDSWLKEKKKEGFSQADKIREAISQTEGPFKAKWVTTYVQRFFPQVKHTSISTSLIRMERREKYLRRRGQEGRETIYEKI